MAFQHSSTTMMRWRSLAATTWASHAPAQTKMAEKAGLWSTADRSMTMPGPDQSTLVVDAPSNMPARSPSTRRWSPRATDLASLARLVGVGVQLGRHGLGRSHQQVHHVAQRRHRSAAGVARAP